MSENIQYLVPVYLGMPLKRTFSGSTITTTRHYVMRQLSAITYQDNVLIHSKDHESQLVELQKCFDRLRTHGLKLNVVKCSFGQIEVAYLRFTLTQHGILPGKDKTAAIKEFTLPQTKRQVRDVSVAVLKTQIIFWKLQIWWK